MYPGRKHVRLGPDGDRAMLKPAAQSKDKTERTVKLCPSTEENILC